MKREKELQNYRNYRNHRNGGEDPFLFYSSLVPSPILVILRLDRGIHLLFSFTFRVFRAFRGF